MRLWHSKLFLVTFKLINFQKMLLKLHYLWIHYFISLLKMCILIILIILITKIYHQAEEQKLLSNDKAEVDQPQNW